MLALTRLRPQPDHRIAFLQGFFERPKEVGSIIPSSRFLERRIVRCAGVSRANLIVELGPGTGGTTRALLRAMHAAARLLVIEINPRFVALLRRTPDPRLTVHCGDAAEIAAALEAHDLSTPDLILSGIPFSTMNPRVGREILHSVHSCLEPGGLFVAYQLRDRVENLGRKVFGRADVQTEFLNVPPMRIYRWRKGRDPAGSAAAEVAKPAGVGESRPPSAPARVQRLCRAPGWAPPQASANSPPRPPG